MGGGDDNTGGDDADEDEGEKEAGTAVIGLPYLSWMAARALNQFMNADVISESVR